MVADNSSKFMMSPFVGGGRVRGVKFLGKEGVRRKRKRKKKKKNLGAKTKIKKIIITSITLT